MSHGQNLRDLLAPLGVYRWEGSFQWGELQSEGEALDQVAEQVALLQREMNLYTAQAEGLTGLLELLGLERAGETLEELRQTVAALLRIGGDSFTLAAMNDTLRGCGIPAQVEETEILFSINTNQVFAADTGKGNILFENPAENQKLVRLEICRLDSGESIYESGYIKPGYYIAEETLDTVPEPGDYPCKAYVYGYRQNNYEYIGKVETDIIVSVQPSVNE